MKKTTNKVLPVILLLIFIYVAIPHIADGGEPSDQSTNLPPNDIMPADPFEEFGGIDYANLIKNDGDGNSGDPSLEELANECRINLGDGTNNVGNLGELQKRNEALEKECKKIKKPSDKEKDVYIPISGTDFFEEGEEISIGNLLNKLVSWLIAIAIMLAVLFIVLGSVQYMTTDAFTKKHDGKEMIQSAIGGLVLALISWLILYQINPNLLKNDLDIPAIPINNSDNIRVRVAGGIASGKKDNNDNSNKITDINFNDPQISAFFRRSSGGNTIHSNLTKTGGSKFYESSIASVAEEQTATVEEKYAPKNRVDVIGDENMVNTATPSGAISIATNKENITYILSKRGGSPFNLYYNDGNNENWREIKSILGPEINESPSIKIDKNNLLWIQGSKKNGVADIQTDEGKKNGRCCNSISLIKNIDDADPTLWGPKKIDTGYAGTIDVDPFYPNKLYHFNNDGIMTNWSSDGVATNNNVQTAGGGKEVGAITISPREGQPGIIHTISGKYYRNQTLTEDRVFSTEFVFPMREDNSYVAIGSDLTNPKIAYIVAPFVNNKLILNIWDGSSMLKPTSNPPVIDDQTSGKSAQGSGKMAPGIAPAKLGGAWVCWTSAGKIIKLKYIAPVGSDKSIQIGPGEKCAITTDDNGDINMAYSNNGLKYRKIITTSAIEN